MAFLFRWLMRAVLALAALGVAGLALAYYLADQSLPDYDHAYTLAGPEQEIEIVRDRYAVPHILSKTDADAFFGLGFVHAQDRLWQMTLLRRTVQGRLSEIFGPETLEIDKLMRALDLYGLARQAVAVQSDDTRAALESYADGVNAWLRVVQEQALGRGAPEFFLFSPDIAPWIPAELDRDPEALRAPVDRQGGARDPARPPVAGAAAGAAARHPAGFAERADHGPAGVLPGVPRPAAAPRSSRRHGARSTRCPSRASAAPRTPSPPWGGAPPAARRSSPPTPTWA